MLFLIMCCCGNILQHGTVGRAACAISGLAQITVALNYCIPLSISYIYIILFEYLVCARNTKIILLCYSLLSPASRTGS